MSDDIADTLERQRCASCGMIFGIPKSLSDLRRINGDPFYCPNGHSLYFKGSTAKKLEEVTKERDEWKKEAARLLEQCDQMRAERRPKPADWWSAWGKHK